MKFRVLALAVAATVAAPAFAAGEQPATAVAVRTVPANKPFQFGPSTEALDGTAFYSNVTTFSGFAGAPGGAAADPAAAANTITRMNCDDVTYNATVARTMSGYRFNVSNLNSTVVTARPRTRFYSDNAGAPGNYIGGNSFTPIAFAASSVTTYTASPLGASIAFPATGAAVKIWACIVFDNNGAAAPTGATVAELNNLGMGLFGPPDRGTSADIYFQTTANGSFLANNPAGATSSFGGAPAANFGWELLDATTMPVELQSFEVK